MKIKYNEKYLERRFKNWSRVELRLYLEELLEKKDNNKLEPGEILCIQPVREELERRLKAV